MNKTSIIFIQIFYKTLFHVFIRTKFSHSWTSKKNKIFYPRKVNQKNINIKNLKTKIIDKDDNIYPMF